MLCCIRNLSCSHLLYDTKQSLTLIIHLPCKTLMTLGVDASLNNKQTKSYMSRTENYKLDYLNGKLYHVLKRDSGRL